MLRVLALLALVSALAVPAQAQLAHPGKLRVTSAGRGRIDLTSGQATFWFRGWEILPAADSDGIDPASEPVTIGVAEERFMIPAGQLQASRNGKHFRYKSRDARGVQLLTLVRTSAGTWRVGLKIAGVDLSSLVVSDPPLCLSFAVVVGNDDGFTGLTFDRPKPFPSKLLTIPGFCTSNTDWPWA